MILSTAYLPPVMYFQKIVQSEKIVIEQHEHFIKQTYRSRCHILGPNGLQVLSIPLVNTHTKTPIHEMRIAYKENWQKIHWRGIKTAYSNSPYFLYYADELVTFYDIRTEFLLDYNTALLKFMLKLLKVKREIVLTDKYQEPGVFPNDLRNSISPKLEAVAGFKPYTQVFGEKHGFVPNLSIIDLLFNKGPDSLEILNEIRE